MHAATARPPSGSVSGSGRHLLLSAFRRERTLLSAALRTMSSGGDCHAPARPLRYPRDGAHQDLTRIGRDMYRAMGWHGSETLDA